MSVKRAIWVEDTAVTHCAQCESYVIETHKRSCRKCGLIFCRACCENKCFIPKDELVAIPQHPNELAFTDDFRSPHHVCDDCFYALADIQAELVEGLSRLEKPSQNSYGAVSALPTIDDVFPTVQQTSGKIAADQQQFVSEEVVALTAPSPKECASPVINFVNRSVLQAQLTVSEKHKVSESKGHVSTKERSVEESTGNGQDGYSSVDYESDDFEPVGDQSAVLEPVPQLMASVTEEYGTDFEEDTFEPADVLERDSISLATGDAHPATATAALTGRGTVNTGSISPTFLLSQSSAGRGNWEEKEESGHKVYVREARTPPAQQQGEERSSATAGVDMDVGAGHMDAELDEYMQPYLDNGSQQSSSAGNNMSIDSLPPYDLPPSGKAPHFDPAVEGIAVLVTEPETSTHSIHSHSTAGVSSEERPTTTVDDAATTVQTSAAGATDAASTLSSPHVISSFIHFTVSQAQKKVVSEAISSKTVQQPAVTIAVPTVQESASEPEPEPLRIVAPSVPPGRQSEVAIAAAAAASADGTKEVQGSIGEENSRSLRKSTESSPRKRPLPLPMSMSVSEPKSPSNIQPTNSQQPKTLINPIVSFVSSAVLQAQVAVSAKYASPAKQRPEAVKSASDEGDNANTDAQTEHAVQTTEDCAPAQQSSEEPPPIKENAPEEPQETETTAAETIDELPPSGPMVWDEDLEKLMPYDQYASMPGTTSVSAKDTNRVSQLRSTVSANRDSSPASPPPKKKMTKKQLEAEADRTFLTSIQYVPPAKATTQANPYGNRRPGTATATAKSVATTITKRDLLRARSAGTIRPATAASASSAAASSQHRRFRSPHRRKSPPKSPKRTVSPYHAEPYPVPRPQSSPKATASVRPSSSSGAQGATVDKRKLFVPPPLLLPSKSIPKELEEYLFATEKESELKMSLFCQHGRHFAACKADLCIDAHEKYRWLNLVHQKAKLACELVCDADKIWRKKLEDSLAVEVEEKKEEFEQELLELNSNAKKRNSAAVRLLKQGVRFYESVQPAMHRGEVTADELHAATGWTHEHYENFKRRLLQEQERADLRRKKMLDQQAHKHQEMLETLKNSLSSPMMYLDGMLKSRLEKIHSAVRKIDLCFQYSIKLAVGNGKGKSEEELRAEMMARSPLKNVVMAERLARNTLHGFDILKASLSIIADICSDVRLMYRGIKRDHTLKQERSEKRNSDFAMNNTAEGARSRTPSPARQSRPKTPQSANGGAGAGGSRPHSAPSSSASPVRKKKIKKRAVQSAHESRRGHQHQRQNNNRTVSPQGSRVSYSGDFEEGSAEIPDDTSTYGKGSRDGDDDDGDGDGISDVMKEVLDEASSRRVSATSNSLRQGSGSIVEDILEVAADGDADGVEIDMDLPVQRPYSSKGGPGSRGGGNSRGASNNYNHNYSSNNNRNRSAEATAEEEVDSEAEEFPGEASYEVNVGNMYEDDFDQDSAVLLSNAFQGGDQQATVKSESAKSTQQKRKKRSKKISKLIHSDNLLQPLARMKLTQRNQQSVLHGLLLSNNIPLHYSEEEHVMGAGTGKKPPHIVVTDSWDRPIPINIPTKTAKLASGAKQFKSSGGVGRKSAAATSLPVGILKNSSNVAAGSKLLQSTSTAVASSDNSGVLLKCHQCRRKVSSSLAKHLPVQNATSDARVLERAKAHQKETGQLFPTFERMHVASSTGAQHEWFRQQQELQQNLLHGQGSGHGLKDSTLPGKGQGSDAGQVASVRRGSVSMQKYDYPFCSWECVKGFALSTCTLQQKYEMDILIDIAAGYTVHQPQAAAAEK